ncbi:MAG: DUF721 domain-containing protein [Deltaproteobacteria bacterium]|nr:DUF721 domain-containing protein [Deltaproteobacteria bacterium]
MNGPIRTRGGGPRVRQNPVRLGEVLEGAFRASGLNRRMQEERIRQVWSEAVGEAVATRAQPERLQNRVLKVRVSSSAAMQQLQFMKPAILEGLRRLLEEDLVGDLRFYLGEVEVPAGGVGTEGELGEAGPDAFPAGEKERIRGELSPVRDPELKEILFRLYLRGRREKPVPPAPSGGEEGEG